VNGKNYSSLGITKSKSGRFQAKDGTILDNPWNGERGENRSKEEIHHRDSFNLKPQAAPIDSIHYPRLA
jgi:hypothetical protein